MLAPNDADRALCALKYSQNQTTRQLAEVVVQQYLLHLIERLNAVRQAQQIANSADSGRSDSQAREK